MPAVLASSSRQERRCPVLLVSVGANQNSAPRDLASVTFYDHTFAPGLPVSLAMTPRPMLLVLKSGSFGSAAFAVDAVASLRNLHSTAEKS